MESILPKLQRLRPGTLIPKPEAHSDFVIKGWGKRRGENALIYLIPNHGDPGKPHQKGITVSEFGQAYKRLLETGGFEKTWFDINMPGCSKEGSCNFTTIGGIFDLLGLAAYDSRGRYRRLPSNRDPRP